MHTFVRNSAERPPHHFLSFPDDNIFQGTTGHCYGNEDSISVGRSPTLSQPYLLSATTVLHFHTVLSRTRINGVGQDVTLLDCLCPLGIILWRFPRLFPVIAKSCTWCGRATGYDPGDECLGGFPFGGSEAQSCAHTCAWG